MPQRRFTSTAPHLLYQYVGLGAFKFNSGRKECSLRGWYVDANSLTERGRSASDWLEVAQSGCGVYGVSTVRMW